VPHIVAEQSEYGDQSDTAQSTGGGIEGAEGVAFCCCCCKSSGGVTIGIATVGTMTGAFVETKEPATGVGAAIGVAEAVFTGPGNNGQGAIRDVDIFGGLGGLMAKTHRPKQEKNKIIVNITRPIVIKLSINLPYLVTILFFLH